MSSTFHNFMTATNSQIINNQRKPLDSSPIVENTENPPSQRPEKKSFGGKNNLDKNIIYFRPNDIQNVLYKTGTNPVKITQNPDHETVYKVYNERCKCDHKFLYQPKLDHLSEGQNKRSNYILMKQNMKEKLDVVQHSSFTPNMQVSNWTIHSPYMLRNENNSTKRNVPVLSLREREKYNIHEAKPVVDEPVINQNSIRMKQYSHFVNIGTQTDLIGFKQDEENEIIKLLKSRNINLTKLARPIPTVVCDVGTNTDNIHFENKQKVQDINEAARLKQIQACRLYDKILRKKYSNLSKKVHPNLPVIERVDFVTESNGTKDETIKEKVEPLNLSFGETRNKLDQQTTGDNSSVFKRRKVSLPTLVQNNIGIKNQTAIQFPLAQQPQVAITAEKQLSFYHNAEPQMIQSYAMQQRHDIVPQYQSRNEHWPHPQLHAEGQPMAYNLLPSNAMNVQQPMYRHGNPAHVSSYTSNYLA